MKWSLLGTIAATVVGAFVQISCVSPADARGSPPGFSLPPPVPDRIGRAQIFDFHIPDKSVMIGRRDVIWDAQGPRLPGIYSTSYLMDDRDPNRTHDLSWLKSNHPDWIVYGCDQAPIREFGDVYPSVDINNPEVRQDIFEQGVLGALAKRPFDAIGVDNVENSNGFKECGVSANGQWRQLYSGQRVEAAFADAQADWMRWLAARVHGKGLALAGNLSYGGADRASFIKVAQNLDVVLDEEGFERKCRPSQTGARWLDRITLYRDLAREKSLVAIEKVCPTLAEITPQTINWSLANYLLIKSDRTYLSLNPEQQGYAYFNDFPDYYLKIGRPMGPMAQRGGVYFRQFERALALVNPSATSSASFNLGQEGWRDRVTREVRSGPITLPPATATVLVKAGA